MTTPMTTFNAAMILDGEWELTGYEPNEENFLAACQHLINTGVAWKLQGRVGRTCDDMIRADLCHA